MSEYTYCDTAGIELESLWLHRIMINIDPIIGQVRRRTTSASIRQLPLMGPDVRGVTRKPFFCSRPRMNDEQNIDRVIAILIKLSKVQPRISEAACSPDNSLRVPGKSPWVETK